MQPTFNVVAETICRTAELGLTITDAADADEFTVISAHPIDSWDKCPRGADTQAGCEVTSCAG